MAPHSDNFKTPIKDNNSSFLMRLSFNRTLRFVVNQHNHKIRDYEIHKALVDNKQYCYLTTTEIINLLSFIRVGYIKVKNDPWTRFLESILL